MAVVVLFLFLTDMMMYYIKCYVSIPKPTHKDNETSVCAYVLSSSVGWWVFPKEARLRW